MRCGSIVMGFCDYYYPDDFLRLCRSTLMLMEGRCGCCCCSGCCGAIVAAMLVLRLLFLLIADVLRFIPLFLVVGDE